MIEKEVKYSLSDIQVVPATRSSIESRSEANPYLNGGMLPLFTAPMDGVVDENNYERFEKNKIIPIIPRTTPLEKRFELLNLSKWVAFSLREAEEYLVNPLTIYNGRRIVPFDSPLGGKNRDWYNPKEVKILIDIANGHMEKLYRVAKSIKYNIPNSTIMVGNIANPITYHDLCLYYGDVVDYVRVGIGGGNCCLTASNTSIFYPMASLIEECSAHKRLFGSKKHPKIVADGGMKNYSDIIKALALGADYVMCGSLFAKMQETPGEVYNEDGDVIDQYSWVTGLDEKLFKKFHGMSTKAVQRKMSGDKMKTSEGLSKTIEVEYTMQQWTENFTDYLCSAMSYTNSRTLEEFKNARKIVVSQNAANSFNK